MDLCHEYAANNPCMPTHMYVSPDVYQAILYAYRTDWPSMRFDLDTHSFSRMEIHTGVGPVKIIVMPKYTNLMLIGTHDAINYFEKNGPPYEFLCESEKLILDQIVEQELLGDE